MKYVLALLVAVGLTGGSQVVTHAKQPWGPIGMGNSDGETKKAPDFRLRTPATAYPVNQLKDKD